MTNKKPKTGFRDHPENINRKGRPPLGTTFSEYVRNFIEETDEGRRKSIVAEMLEIATKKARRGHFQFWDAIANRAYGKVVEKIELPQAPKVNLSRLSDQELATLRQLLEKAKP